MAIGYIFYRPFERARSLFVDLMCRTGWAVALALVQALYVVAETWRFVEWCWAEAFPYPANLLERPRGSRSTWRTLGHAEARAYQRRRLERQVDHGVATGVGLRLAV